MKSELEALDEEDAQGNAASEDPIKSEAEKDRVRDMSLSKLEGKTSDSVNRETLTLRKKPSRAVAKIVLREEKANIFHDFLKFVYPQ